MKIPVIFLPVGRLANRQHLAAAMGMYQRLVTPNFICSSQSSASPGKRQTQALLREALPDQIMLEF